MQVNPLNQFKIKKIFDISLIGIDISITNSVLFMICAVLSVLVIFAFVIRVRHTVIPGKFYLAIEEFYLMMANMVNKNITSHDRKFVPFVFSLFIIILVFNLFGILPGSFTVTSHISVTFALACVVFCVINIFGLVTQGFGFFKMFLPSGTPMWLAPMMIVIEIFTFLARPVSLSLRLAANMIAGHVLLKIIAAAAVVLSIYLKFIPISFIVVMTGFEVFVAILQAYIFSILSCVYIGSILDAH